MGLFERLREWASAGSMTDPGDSYIAAGWQYRVRPPRQYWNYVENDRDSKINKLASAVEQLGTVSPDATYQDLCAERAPDWSEPMASPNYLSTGTVTKDSCVIWDHVNNKPRLLVLQGNNIYPVEAPWDYSAAPVLGSALSLSYASTPDDVICICSDGDYLFVAYGVTSGEVIFSKFSLVTFTGTDLWGYGSGINYDDINAYTANIIVADDDYLAFHVYDPTGGGYIKIVTMLRTSGARTSGYGNGIAGDAAYWKSSKIVSDGTHVYWIAAVDIGGGSFDWILCSALIATPASSSYSRITIDGNVLATANDIEPVGLSYIRGVVVVSNLIGQIYMYVPGEGTIRTQLEIDGIDAVASTVSAGPVMASDGLNLWYFTLEVGILYTSGYVLYKIPSGLVTRGADTTGLRSITLNGLFVDEDTHTTDHDMGNLLNDGRDLWLVTEIGDLFRITNPGAR